MRIPLRETFVHASIRKRLWLGAGAVAVFIGTLAVALLLAPSDPHAEGKVGLDFIAFYTGGSFVREGRSADLFDIRKVHRFQFDLAAQHGVDLGHAVGPWWNPPFYSWVFVPLSLLDYRDALHLWMAINVLCALIAAGILCSWIALAKPVRSAPGQPRGLLEIATEPVEIKAPESSHGANWRTWMLVPVLMILSTPFIHALSHAQNTCTSLLIVTLAVAFWRTERPVAAGLITGLMFYKPQLGAVLSVMLVLSLGWRALIGLSITGAVLLLATLALPGSLHDFLFQMPKNVHYVQCDVPYLWDRHVTFKAFWRLLFQGFETGEPTMLVSILANSCSGIAAAALLWSVWRTRKKLHLIGPADLRRLSPTPRLRVRGQFRSLLNSTFDSWFRPSLSSSMMMEQALAGFTSVGGPPRTHHKHHTPIIAPADIDSTQIAGAGMGALAKEDISRLRTAQLDRLIAATIAATPLVMPFYFDYDQLLLLIPAALWAIGLLSHENRADRSSADRWLLRIWPVQYVWLMINPDVAARTHLNAGVLLLALVAMSLIARAMAPMPAAAKAVEEDEPVGPRLLAA